MTLRLKTLSAIRWTTTAAVVRASVQVLQVAALARLPSPEDYGLMAVVGAILTLAGLFADMGINRAYVQCYEISLEQRSSLFWANIALSAVLTVFVIGASPFLSWVFGDPRLSPLIMLSASTFMLGALGQQVRMSAEKELDFRPVVIGEICATILAFATAVLAALGGWGVYSLVTSGIVFALASTGLAWAFAARGWRPMWRLRAEDVRPFLRFGSASVANDIVNQINLTMDLILGGRALSAAQLGLYSVPRSLILQIQSMVNPIITRVGFPLIAQVQLDVERVRFIYLKSLNMTASINAPLHIGIAFFAPEIVAVVLGAHWEPAASLLRLLALWGGLRSTGNPVGILLFGMGRADLALRWNLVLFGLVPAVIWLGSRGGPTGMAWALLCLQIVLFVPAWFFLVRPLCRAGLVEYLISTLKPFLISGLSIAPAYLVANQFDGAMLRLMAGIALSAPLYVVLSFTANREWITAISELVWKRTG